MKLQLKRSNVLENGAAKKPDAVQMEYGELAVNYNSSDPTIFLKDSTNTIVRIGADDYLSIDGGTVTGDVSIDGTLGVTQNITATSDVGIGGALTVTGDVVAGSFTGDGSGLTNVLNEPPDLQTVLSAGNTTTVGANFGGPVSVHALTATGYDLASLPVLP